MKTFKEFLKETREVPSFEPGDKVKIIMGNYEGRRGTIVDVAPARDMYVVKIGKNKDYLDAFMMKRV